MVSLHPVASPRTRSKPLAACIAALCGLSASTAMATGATWDVTDCSDNGGPGTLRSVISAVTTMTADIVNLSSAPCGTITLAAGNTAIPVAQANLRIQTSGNDHITIDGSALKSGVTSGNASRIFSHLGTGTLTLQGVTLTGGHVYPLAVSAYGGCIRSAGNVELINSTVTSCSAQSAAAATSKLKVYGGGIFASGNVTLTGSTVSNNSATSANYSVNGAGIFATGNVVTTHSMISGNYGKGQGTVGGGIHAKTGTITLSYSTVSGNTLKSLSADHGAYGGGIYSPSGALTASYSTISGNSVFNDAGLAAGGGIYTHGSLTLRKSTISDNYSSVAIGGIAAFLLGSANSNHFYMLASTVSGNSSGGLVGGIGVNSSTTKIYNSTIAFNTAVNYYSTLPRHYYSPGVSANYRPSVGPATLTLQSTIIANNTIFGGYGNDLSAGVVPGKVVIQGSNNLVRKFGSDVTLPASQGNISGVCPLLGPLRDNGGGSYTHALHSGSPGVAVGNNTTADPLTQITALYDQRGPGYARAVDGNVDMGAYQRQHDNIFDAAFDRDCP